MRKIFEFKFKKLNIVSCIKTQHTWTDQSILILPIIILYWNLPKVYCGIHINYIFWILELAIEKVINDE